MKHTIPRRNHSGYVDPTAHDALAPIQREQDEVDQRANNLIHMLKYLIRSMGFEPTKRIEFQDRKTGRYYR